MKKSDQTKTQKQFKEAFGEKLNALEKIPLKFTKMERPIEVIDTTPPPSLYPIFSTDTLSYTSLSTYPFRNGKKIGNPICDKAKAVMYKDVMIVVIADGCGLGTNVFSASENAVNTITKSMIENIDKCKTTTDVAEVMVDSVVMGHFSIIEKSPETFCIGTTTVLLSVVAFTMTNLPVILTLSIGDCSAFIISKSQSRACQVVSDSKTSLKEATDCGGRIGPFVDKNFPDLRNASLTLTHCEKNDVFLVATDGFVDNFNPSFLGNCPSELGLFCQDWEAARECPNFLEKKKKWTENLVYSFFNTSQSISNFIEKMSEYVVGTTQASRRYLETKPGERLPIDPVRYPGKCDHGTVIAFKIKKRIEETEDLSSIIPMYSSSLFGGGEAVGLGRMKSEKPQKLVVCQNPTKSAKRDSLRETKNTSAAEIDSQASLEPIEIFPDDVVIKFTPEDKPLSMKFSSESQIPTPALGRSIGEEIKPKE
ncbi:hypothetical protein EIN_389910 [Entamoeba invadens IP1]|uniref:PPM-type phosphatase domain-containing protein n=1 Tax=Entamoeba invadens IP1 TaxID=370355 RepID=A0A0A1UB38_ENTIV|nr:hypothetical protein EIN_389910 [Entamoeba invadens IP1]ELP89406.1 hypothetical protein EIN_389910 [Entamoeba invadens IP1]|eukprot:XP_004256177.1 hypothetical protein EIN_389910 [Entamoeba invadens IP1]